MKKLVRKMHSGVVPMYFNLDFVFKLNKRDWDGLQEVFNELEAYEATNHTPEECAAAFEELAAYRAAEQDGTLLRMPCKQYTTIYYILDKTVYVGWYLAKAGQTTSLILQDRIEMGVCWCNDDSWFFTSEEAEITLKEQEGQKCLK